MKGKGKEFEMTLRISQGLSKEELIDQLKISEQNFSNYLSRLKHYITQRGNKYYYKNPFEDMPKIIHDLGERKLNDILREGAKNKVIVKLLTNGMDNKMELLYEEYKKTGGIF